MFIEGEWKLIDLDASTTMGAPIEPRARSFKWTSSVAPPEVAQRALWSGVAAPSLPPLVATPAVDVFMLGALFFEVTTRTTLFGPVDGNDDSLTSPQSEVELFTWHGVDDARLSRCFASAAGASGPAVDALRARRVAECKDLLRGMLHGDPATRFTMSQVLGHRFLNPATAPRGAPHARDSAAPRPRVHFFISCHLGEAEEQLSRLAALVQLRTSCTTWDSARSLEDGDFDAERARVGIGACDVFICVLTNGHLLSHRGIAELAAAIELRKPIIMLAELDPWNRSVFDYKRWVANAVKRDTATREWVTAAPGDVEVPYASCPANVQALIEARRRSVIPYGRSGGAAAAMISDIFRLVAHECGGAFPWAHVVRAAAQAQEARSGGGATSWYFAVSEPSDIRGDDEWSTLESSVPY